MLECGVETGTAFKQLIAAFLGVPIGELLTVYRRCLDHLTNPPPQSRTSTAANNLAAAANMQRDAFIANHLNTNNNNNAAGMGRAERHAWMRHRMRHRIGAGGGFFGDDDDDEDDDDLMHFIRIGVVGRPAVGLVVGLEAVAAAAPPQAPLVDILRDADARAGRQEGARAAAAAGMPAFMGGGDAAAVRAELRGNVAEHAAAIMNEMNDDAAAAALVRPAAQGAAGANNEERRAGLLRRAAAFFEIRRRPGINMDDDAEDHVALHARRRAVVRLRFHRDAAAQEDARDAALLEALDVLDNDDDDDRDVMDLFG